MSLIQIVGSLIGLAFLAWCGWLLLTTGAKDERICWGCGNLIGRDAIEMHGKSFCQIQCLPGRQSIRRVQ